MPRYKFKWTNLDAKVLKGLCQDLDLDMADPATSLRSHYGARPTDDFVREAWPALRDRWLTKDGPSRRRVVDDLWALGLGHGDQPSHAAEQMSFLGSRNNARRLRDVVLDVFVLLGEATTVAKETPVPTDQVVRVPPTRRGEGKPHEEVSEPGTDGVPVAAKAQVAPTSNEGCGMQPTL